MNFVIYNRRGYGAHPSYGVDDLIDDIERWYMDDVNDISIIRDWANNAKDGDNIPLGIFDIIATDRFEHAVLCDLVITPVISQNTIIPKLAYNDYDMYYNEMYSYHRDANVDIRHIRIKYDSLKPGFMYNFDYYDPYNCDEYYDACGTFMVIDRVPASEWTEYYIIEVVNDENGIHRFLSHYPQRTTETSITVYDGTPIDVWAKIFDEKHKTDYAFKKIESIMRIDYGCDKTYSDMISLYFNTDLLRFCIIAPHDGNNHKWLLRMCANASFDRWANSGREKEFDTPDEIIDYLLNHRDSVYMEIIENLSYEHCELKDVVRNRR